MRNTGQRPLHILYVHGIGAQGAGDSLAFRESICAFLKGCEVVPANPAARDYADGGEFADNAEAPAFEYMGKPVGRTRMSGAPPRPLSITTCCGVATAAL